jgi:hypothetical protein
MTRRAACELSRRADFVFRRKLFPDFVLICRGLPIHVENLIARPQHLFGVAVAIQAPGHKQWRSLKDQRHLIDGAVASGAANALIYMDAVIEIRKIREAVDFDPLNGAVSAVAFANRFEVSGIVEEDRVAIHAGFRGGDACNRRSFDSRMTIAAINAVIADMMFVAELHGLLAGDVLIGQIGGACSRKDAHKREANQKNGGENTEARDEIRAAVKNLGHVSFALGWQSVSNGCGL